MSFARGPAPALSGTRSKLAKRNQVPFSEAAWNQHTSTRLKRMARFTISLQVLHRRKAIFLDPVRPSDESDFALDWHEDCLHRSFHFHPFFRGERLCE
jgi:hypothetical protein